MSELSVLEKAIENSQKEVKELIEEQRKSIQVKKEELKATGTRLFDLEQKLAGNSPDQTAQKSFAQRVSEDLMKGWDGSRTKAKVTSFDKAIGSGAASAGALIQPRWQLGLCGERPGRDLGDPGTALMHRHDSAWHDEYASRRTSVIEREGAESDEPGARNANWVIDRGIGAERPPRFARIGEAILALKF